MTERIFQFNPLLFRVCNQTTWSRMRTMNGRTVTVDQPPHRVEGVLVNVVSGVMPDGLHIKFEVFNSELRPVLE